MQVGNLSASPGTRSSGWVGVTVCGVDVTLPVFLINGATDGPRLSVTAGIHGGEYPCVEAARRLGCSLDPSAISGQVLIIPSANPTAFTARSIYVNPEDGKNLNRQFPGDPNGTFTEAWADWLFRNVILGSDAYIDLHGGDMIEALVPFVAFDRVGNSTVDDGAERMAEAFGIRYALARQTSGGPSGTTVSAAANAGVPSLLAEAGGQGVWDEQNVEILHSGVIRVLASMDMLSNSAARLIATVEPSELEWLEGWSWLRSAANGLFYSLVSVGDVVHAGQPLGRVADIFGETLQELSAPASGTVLFLVTSLAMNEGDPLLAIAF
ncbi:succinylglutamate desuccinylase/aspartoacylase family protein [Bacteroidota bacterium]